MGSRHAGFSSCGTWALQHQLNSRGAQASLHWGMWDLPGSGIKPVSPALAGGLFTTEPPGKPSGSFSIPTSQHHFSQALTQWYISFTSMSLLCSLSGSLSSAQDLIMSHPEFCNSLLSDLPASGLSPCNPAFTPSQRTGSPQTLGRVPEEPTIHDLWFYLHEVAQSCLTLRPRGQKSAPSSSIHGIFQARVLEWVAISFSRESSLPRDWTQVSHIVDRCFTVWATSKVPWTTYLFLNFVCKCQGTWKL